MIICKKSHGSVDLHRSCSYFSIALLIETPLANSWSSVHIYCSIVSSLILSANSTLRFSINPPRKPKIKSIPFRPFVSYSFFSFLASCDNLSNHCHSQLFSSTPSVIFSILNTRSSLKYSFQPVCPFVR